MSRTQGNSFNIRKENIMELLNNHYEDRRSLIDACQSGNVDIVRHLVIDKHCDVNVRSR
uniref:Uncharacterized protein n=1 Tax=Amphimedon queenslandica TaxID=400682 RepID=A0A1X7T0I2_AMPQE